jgi:hypothetical protein
VVLAQPKIRAYYQNILADFSISDTTHALHYLLKLLENMQRVDRRQLNDEDENTVKLHPLELARARHQIELKRRGRWICRALKLQIAKRRFSPLLAPGQIEEPLQFKNAQ